MKNMLEITDTSGHDQTIIKEFNQVVSKYNPQDVNQVVLDIILTRHFDDNDFESLIDLLKEDLHFGDYTYDIVNIGGREEYDTLHIVRKSDLKKDAPEDTFDNVPIIRKLLKSEGVPKDKIVFTAECYL
jgi:hypothetical protein